MKYLINTIIHGVGVMMFCIGWIICIKAAADNDIGIALADVTRCALAGLTACVGGAFLSWYRV